MKANLATALFLTAYGNQLQIIGLPGSESLIRNSTQQLSMFEHDINVGSFEQVPVFGGQEYRDQVLSELSLEKQPSDLEKILKKLNPITHISRLFESMEFGIKDSITFLEIFFAKLTGSSPDNKSDEDSLIDVQIITDSEEVSEEIQLALLQ